MIFVFVIDTSASMNQRSSGGMTLLDCAKSVTEHFIKQRSRDPQSRSDRYFLVTTTTSQPPAALLAAGASGPGGNSGSGLLPDMAGGDERGSEAIRVGWKDSGNFIQELRNLTANDFGSISHGLRSAFELMNQYRLQTRIDNYGQGQNPWFLDPAACIVLTDGTEGAGGDTARENLVLSMGNSIGQELTLEPYRWDQRVFSICLKLPGIKTFGRFKLPDASKSLVGGQLAAIRALCEATGGVMMIANNVRNALHSMDTILGKLQYPGVVISLQTTTDVDVDPVHNSQDVDNAFVVVRSAPGRDFHWPIPEPFWLDRNNTTLPPRSAHPSLIVLRAPEAAAEAAHTSMSLDRLGFPADKYELHANLKEFPPLGVRWPVYVRSIRPEAKPGSCDAIGYVTTSATAAGKPPVLVLVLLPYNYPRLFSLLAEAARATETLGLGGQWQFQPSKFSAAWRQGLSAYIISTPTYYYGTLKKVLKRYNLHTFVPDLADGGRSFQVNSYLMRLWEMKKAENEKPAVKADKPRPMDLAIAKLEPTSTTIQSAFSTPLSLLRARCAELRQCLESKLQLGASAPSSLSSMPSPLISQITSRKAGQWRGDFGRMSPSPRAVKEDGKHFVPIGEMGNYQPVLLKKEAPRDPLAINPDVDEDTIAGLRRRQLQVHFGNPYKRKEAKTIPIDGGDTLKSPLSDDEDSRESQSSVTDGEEVGEAVLLNQDSAIRRQRRKRHRSYSSRFRSWSLSSDTSAPSPPSLSSSEEGTPPSSPILSDQAPSLPSSDVEMEDNFTEDVASASGPEVRPSLFPNTAAPPGDLPLDPSADGKTRGSPRRRGIHSPRSYSYETSATFTYKTEEDVAEALARSGSLAQRNGEIHQLIRKARTSVAEINQILAIFSDMQTALGAGVAVYISAAIRQASHFKKTKIVEALRGYSARRGIRLG